MWWCPGCERPHVADKSFRLARDTRYPTLWPALVVEWLEGDPPQPRRCEAVMTLGMLDFGKASSHGLAGKSVRLPDWPRRRMTL